MNLSSLNILDYVVLFIIFLSVLFGFSRGFIRSLLSLLGWVLAGYAAYVFFPTVKPFLLSHFPNELLVSVAGPVGVFFALLIVISLVNYQLVHLLGGMCGNGIDRSMGLAFGLARGTLIVSVIFIALTMVTPGLTATSQDTTYRAHRTEADKSEPDWLQQAQSYTFLKIGSAMVLSLLPENVTDTLFQFTGKVKSAGNNATSPPPASQVLEVAEQMRALLPNGAHINSLAMNLPDNASTEMLAQRQKEVLHIILEMYNTALKSGKIAKENALPAEKLRQLEEAVYSSKKALSGTAKGTEEQNGNKNTGGTMPGYDKKQINELNRLMETVQ